MRTLLGSLMMQLDGIAPTSNTLKRFHVPFLHAFVVGLAGRSGQCSHRTGKLGLQRRGDSCQNRFLPSEHRRRLAAQKPSKQVGGGETQEAGSI